VKANQASYPVSMMCRLLEVSTSGYYAWLKRPPSKRSREDAILTDRIRWIYLRSRSSYGAPRVYEELKDEGVRVGRKRVARLMRAAGLQGISRRKRVRTTIRKPGARPAPDLVDRDFTADRPDQLWVADITYIHTWVGFLYLAVVMDAFSRRILGLVDGQSPTGRTGDRCSADGNPAKAPGGSCSPLRSRKPIHVACIWKTMPGSECPAFNGIDWRLLR